MDKLNLKEYTRSDWSILADQKAQGLIFHNTDWLCVLSNCQNLDIKYLGISRDDHIQELIPFCMKSLGKLKIAGSPFVVEDTPYMGPIFNTLPIQDILPLLEKFLKKNKIHHLRIISNNYYCVNNLPSNFKFIDKYTHILDLEKTEDELWNSLKGRCRTAIRKAKKSEIAIKQETERNFIETYYNILKDVYNAQKKPCPNPKNFYYQLWDNFILKNVFFLSAYYNQKFISGAIILIDRNMSYYLNSASIPEYRYLNPTNLILWEAILLAKSKGSKQFDFVGSDIPRLARFKESFGGSLTRHTCIEWSSSKLVELMRKIYPKYKNLSGNITDYIDMIKSR